MADSVEKKPDVAAVIVAAGQGRRMQGIDKVLSPLAGMPILLRATRPFQECAAVSRIIVVISGEQEQVCRQLVTGEEWSKVTDICLGGERRQDSVAEGIKRAGDCDIIIIHDGARPLVTIDLIERGLEAVKETGAAVAAVPVKDTIKTVDKNRIVTGTPARDRLWSVQTPQVFLADVIRKAYRKNNEDVTDDAALVEKSGRKVKLYEGSYDNIKITTPDDMALAELLLSKREATA